MDKKRQLVVMAVLVACLGLLCVWLCARMVDEEGRTWAEERWVGGGGEAKRKPE